MQDNAPQLIVIAGPTAVGKTKTAIRLAQKLQTEIISADSRQIYRQLEIGVGRPSAEELSLVKHHLIGNIDIERHYHAADFERDALAILNTIFKENRYAIVCGGTGLYIRTLLDGMDAMPEINSEIRNQLNERFSNEGIRFLQDFIREKDSQLVNQIDMMNPKRLIRAAEIMIQTGEPYSSFRKGKKINRNFESILFCLYQEREIIRKNIEKRVDEMIEKGWVEECKKLYPYRNIKALQTVGYKEIFDYLDHKTSWEEAKQLIVTHTYQYAKRQMTWFKKDKRYIWVKNIDEILSQLHLSIKS